MDSKRPTPKTFLVRPPSREPCSRLQFLQTRQQQWSTQPLWCLVYAQHCPTYWCQHPCRQLTWHNSRGWWGAWYSPWHIRQYCLNPLATMMPMTTRITRAEDVFHKSWKTSAVNMTVSMVETQLCKLRSTLGTCVLYTSFIYGFCELNLRYDY